MVLQEAAEQTPRDAADPCFDPFRRHDQYGLQGTQRQSVLEYLRLAFLALTLLPLKVLGCVACLIGCYLVCKFSFLVPASKRTAWVVNCGKTFVRMELFCCGFFTVTWKTVPDTRPKHITQGVKAAGIVSNHCSWADILIHMSRSFPSFVARASTKDLLWVGLIRYLVQCCSCRHLTIWHLLSEQSKHLMAAASIWTVYMWSVSRSLQPHRCQLAHTILRCIPASSS